MIFFAAFLLGGIVGIAVWWYVAGFAHRVSLENADFTPLVNAKSAPKCGHFLLYFLMFGLIFSLINQYSTSSLWTLWACIFISIISCIALVDAYYQLISPIFCLWLCGLGFAGAEMNLSMVSLSQSFQSAVMSWGIFYLLYWSSFWLLKKEALGRGDYWLMLGLGSYLSLEMLAFMLCLACGLGILFHLFFGRKEKYLPFAPFLCLATLVVWSLNIC